MSAFVGIECDGCRTKETRRTRVQVSTGPIRAFLKDAGWHTTRGKFGAENRWGYTRDICPTCWAKGIR